MEQPTLEMPLSPERRMQPLTIKSALKKGKTALKKQLINASQVYFGLAGSKVECNICHYKANRLRSNSWHLYSSCPSCNSTVRSRLLYAALTYLDDVNERRLICGKRVLHFAPEDAVRPFFEEKAAEYKTADYLAEGYDYGTIDYNLDITAMPQIPDGRFDCVIACDVLEHVYNLSAGINEVRRVLAKDGYCIFTVPQKDHLRETYEDLSITDPKERERIFGQEDHLRIFGDDFPDMLRGAGFDVTVVNESYFDRALADRYVLSPPVLSENPLATNFRKIFFGKKR